MAKSALFQIIPVNEIFITDISEAKGDNLINGIEAEDRILKKFIIKGPKLDKYYGDRKKLEH